MRILFPCTSNNHLQLCCSTTCTVPKSISLSESIVEISNRIHWANSNFSCRIKFDYFSDCIQNQTLTSLLVYFCKVCYWDLETSSRFQIRSKSKPMFTKSFIKNRSLRWSASRVDFCKYYNIEPRQDHPVCPSQFFFNF